MRLLLALLLLPAVAVAADPPAIRLNQIQVIGTYNSYHVAPAAEVKKLLAAAKKSWPDEVDYTHRPLAEQFGDLGVRQVELDVFADPLGGLFAKPSAFGAIAEKHLQGWPTQSSPDVAALAASKAIALAMGAEC